MAKRKMVLEYAGDLSFRVVEDSQQELAGEFISYADMTIMSNMGTEFEEKKRADKHAELGS